MNTNVFEKFSTGIDNKYGRKSVYYFGTNYNEYCDCESSKDHYTEFAKGAVDTLQYNGINVISVRSFDNHLGKVCNIKATVPDRDSITKVADLLKEYCENKGLTNMLLEGNGILGYASFTGKKLIAEVDKFCNINAHKYTDKNKSGYVILINANSRK